MLYAVLAVTLLNIHKSARLTIGAFRFWGCLPVYSAAAENAGASETQIRHRIAEVHQLSKTIVADAYLTYLLSKTIVADAYLTEHGNRNALVSQSTSSDILR